MVLRIDRATGEAAAGTASEDERFSASHLVGELLERLEGRLGDPQLRTLGSLAAESDPELFGDGLLNLARRSGNSDDWEVAAALYAVLESEACDRMPGIQAKARRERQAMEGSGAAGDRTEFLLGRFVKDATDPSTLFAMGAAGALFRATRFATLARLGANPEIGLLTRGFGARAAASLTGFSVEATAFPLLGRIGAEALGRSKPWTLSQVGHEVASSFFVLGALKFCGHGAFSLARRTQVGARGLVSGLVPRFFQQAGMFGGILLGHGLESWAGLRPSPDGATTMVDSLALLLQFNVAARLSRSAFGRRFTAWERGLDWRTERLSSAVPPPPSRFRTSAWLGPQPLYVAAAVAEPSRARAGTLVRMEGLKNDRGGAAPPGVRYPPQIDAVLTSLEGKIRSPDYLQGTREELLQKRVDSDFVDRIFLHQALEALEGVAGIEARVVDDSVLTEPLAADQVAPRPDLISKVRSLLGARGAEGSVARRVLEIRYAEPFPENASLGPLADLMELLDFLNSAQRSIQHQVHFVNEAGNPRYVARIVMPSYLESLLRAVHGEHALQFHYVDGTIPRDDVMRLRGQGVSPFGIVRHPTYLGDAKREVSAFAFAFHDGYFHAPLDSAKRGAEPGWAARLYRHLQGLPSASEYEGILNGLSELEEIVHEEGTPTMFGRILPALLQETLEKARNESDALKRGEDIGEIHRLAEGLARTVERRFPAPERRNEAQLEFAAQMEELRRSLGIDLSRPNFHYPPVIEAAWRRVERSWMDPAYYEGSREELIAKRPDLDDVDAIWLHQAADYAHRLGADFEILDIGALQNEFTPEGQRRFDPELFDRVTAKLGERGRGGSIARRMVRVRFTPSALAAMDLQNPALRYLGLPPSISDLEDFVGQKVQLTEDLSGEKVMKTDYPALSLLEALFQVSEGKPGTQFHFVPGAIPRDQVLSLRARRVSPVGLARDLTYIGDLGFEIHPFTFAGHDGLFHAARDAEQPDPFPSLGGWLYESLRRRVSPGPLRERLLDNLSDSNFGGPQGTWESFAEAATDPLRLSLLNSQGETTAEAREAQLRELARVLEEFRSILKEEAPAHAIFSGKERHFTDRLDRFSRNLSRLRWIAAAYRGAGVQAPPPYYDTKVLDAIDRVEARFQEPRYMEGSREELRRKRVDLHDAELLWQAQARDFARLIPGAEFHLMDATHLLRPVAGRGELSQDRELIEAAFARLESKFSSEAWEGRQVIVLEVPEKFMVHDLFANRPELEFLRFNPFLNDLENHLSRRVQFFEIRDGKKFFRIPSLAIMESLLEAAYGPERAQLHFVPGEISRDDTARLRGLRVSPVGLSFSPLFSAEFQGPVHSFSFAQHDVLDHASRDASLAAGLPEAMYWLYQEVQRALPATSTRERLLDQLSDLDLPAIYPDPWANLSRRLTSSAWHDYASDAESKDHLSRIETLVRSRFLEYPDLASRRTSFLVDILFARSRGSGFGHSK